MDLRIHFIDGVNQDCRYLVLWDNHSERKVSYRLGFKHEYLISKMNREDAIKRIGLLIRLITKAFAKKYNIQFPERNLKQVFPLTSRYYGR